MASSCASNGGRRHRGGEEEDDDRVRRPAEWQEKPARVSHREEEADDSRIKLVPRRRIPSPPPPPPKCSQPLHDELGEGRAVPRDAPGVDAVAGSSCSSSASSDSDSDSSEGDDEPRPEGYGYGYGASKKFATAKSAVAAENDTIKRGKTNAQDDDHDEDDEESDDDDKDKDSEDSSESVHDAPIVSIAAKVAQDPYAVAVEAPAADADDADDSFFDEVEQRLFAAAERRKSENRDTAISAGLAPVLETGQAETSTANSSASKEIFDSHALPDFGADVFLGADLASTLRNSSKRRAPTPVPVEVVKSKKSLPTAPALSAPVAPEPAPAEPTQRRRRRRTHATALGHTASSPPGDGMGGGSASSAALGTCRRQKSRTPVKLHAYVDEQPTPRRCELIYRGARPKGAPKAPSLIKASAPRPRSEESPKQLLERNGEPATLKRKKKVRLFRPDLPPDHGALEDDRDRGARRASLRTFERFRDDGFNGDDDDGMNKLAHRNRRGREAHPDEEPRDEERFFKRRRDQEVDVHNDGGSRGRSRRVLGASPARSPRRSPLVRRR